MNQECTHKHFDVGFDGKTKSQQFTRYKQLTTQITNTKGYIKYHPKENNKGYEINSKRYRV